jgi:hypothetical protein
VLRQLCLPSLTPIATISALAPRAVGYAQAPEPRRGIVLKKIVELLLCILHPVAVVLIWFNLAFRRDDWAFTRMAWAIVVIIPLVPFVYVLTGNDFI